MTNQKRGTRLDLLKKHQTLLRQIFPKFEGRKSNAIADSFMLEFASAVAALRCALAIQEGLATQTLRIRGWATCGYESESISASR